MQAMKMRRVLIQFEVETNVSIPLLKAATITIPHRGRNAWHLKRDRNDQKSVDAIVRNYPEDPIVHYLESNRVNVIRESTKKRGKRK